MRALYTLCTLPLIAACSGGGESGDGGTDAASECACIDGSPEAGVPQTTIAVLNAGGTAITAFPIAASGDTAPTSVISGNTTNLDAAIALGVDAQHNLYVATQLAILVFAEGATGNVAPSRTIAGPNALPTTDDFVGLAVARDGTIYAASELGSGTNRNPKILVFPPGTNGNVAPAQTITGPTTTMQAVLAMGVFFTQMAEADATENVNFFKLSATGDVAPSRILKDAPGIVEGMTFDAVGALYLARYDFTTSSVISFIAGAQGTPTPLSLLSGTTTKLTAPGGVAVDHSGNVYVTNADPTGAAILVFDPDANGDVPPARIIAGASTTLNGDATQAPMPLVVF